MKLTRWLGLAGLLLLALGAWAWFATLPARERVRYEPDLELPQTPAGAEVPVTLRVYVTGSAGVSLLGYGVC